MTQLNSLSHLQFSENFSSDKAFKNLWPFAFGVWKPLMFHKHNVLTHDLRFRH